MKPDNTRERNLQLSYGQFRASPLEYRPVPFLFLNHELRKQDLARFIREMKDKGVRGFFMHPRDGLLTPYMSKTFRDMVKFMVVEAKRYGLEAWLYDEDPYPSGAAGGKVIYEHPEYRSRVLTVTTGAFRGGRRVVFDIPMGNVVAVFALPSDGKGAVVRGNPINITAHTGPVRDRWHYIRQYSNYYFSQPADTYPHWRSGAGKIKTRTYWNAPAGDWVIVAFVERDQSEGWEPWGGYADLLNPNAVASFIRHTHEVYWKDLKPYFGKTIPGIFTDEPKWVGHLPWTTQFPELFQRAKKYDIRAHLPALLYDTYPDAPDIRYDYWDVLTHRLKESFFDQISAWCEKHHISFTGHVSPEEEPAWGVAYLGDLMQLARAMQIPGTDIITSRIGTEEYPIFNVGPKLISSVAHQQGRKRVLAEAFALADWDYTVQKMKLTTDYLFALGVNFLTPHGFYYSIDGHRKKEACPSQFYQATYWKYYRHFSEYVGRIGYLLTRGEYPAEFALLYPTTSLWRLMPGSKEKARCVSDSFVFINDLLIRNHRQFDFVDDLDLMNADIRDGILKIGKQKYPCVVVPPACVYDQKVTAQLEGFAAAGGRVLWVGDASRMPAGLVKLTTRNVRVVDAPCDIISLTEKQRRQLKEQIASALVEIAPPDVVIAGRGSSEVFVARRRFSAGAINFIVNLAGETTRVRVGIKENGKWEKWNPVTGEVTELPVSLTRDGLEMTFAPGESTIVITKASRVRTEKKGISVSLPGSRKQVKELGANWNFEPENDNVLFLGRWHMIKGGPEDILADGYAAQNISFPVLEPCPIRDVATISSLTVKDVPWLGTVSALSFPCAFCYKLNFSLIGSPEKLDLVWEKAGIQGKYRIFIDGVQIKGKEIQSCCRYDVSNLSVNILPYLRKERPFYTPSVHTVYVFVEADSPDDGLLEPMRIFGNFVVEYAGDKGMGAVLREKTGEARVSCGSWTDYGYPFYSGTAVYCQEFDMEHFENSERYWLEFADVRDIVEIEINGANLGPILWHPFEKEISGFLKDGRNKIVLKVTNSLYNMLEGAPKPSGLLGPVRISVE